MYKYKAFISYSHEDTVFAKWLHESLEKYKIPKELRKDYPYLPKSLFPIFRDREELSVSPDLPKEILKALKSSEYLIIICSVDSAKSQWVNQEIMNFKLINGEEGEEKVRAIILNGEPYAKDNDKFNARLECFPEALKYKVIDGKLSNIPTEPIAGDFREGKDGKEQGKLKLLAGLLNVDFDELNQREEKRKRHNKLILRIFLTFIIFIFSIVTIYIFKLKNSIATMTNKVKELETFIENISSNWWINYFDSSILGVLIFFGKGVLIVQLGFIIFFFYKYFNRIIDSKNKENKISIKPTDDEIEILFIPFIYIILFPIFFIKESYFKFYNKYLYCYCKNKNKEIKSYSFKESEYNQCHYQSNHYLCSYKFDYYKHSLVKEKIILDNDSIYTYTLVNKLKNIKLFHNVNLFPKLLYINTYHKFDYHENYHIREKEGNSIKIIYHYKISNLKLTTLLEYVLDEMRLIPYFYRRGGVKIDESVRRLQYDYYCKNKSKITLYIDYSFLLKPLYKKHLEKLKKIKFTSSLRLLTLRDFEYHRIKFGKRSNYIIEKYKSKVNYRINTLYFEDSDDFKKQQSILANLIDFYFLKRTIM